MFTQRDCDRVNGTDADSKALHDLQHPREQPPLSTDEAAEIDAKHIYAANRDNGPVANEMLYGMLRQAFAAGAAWQRNRSRAKA